MKKEVKPRNVNKKRATQCAFKLKRLQQLCCVFLHLSKNISLNLLREMDIRFSNSNINNFF